MPTSAEPYIYADNAATTPLSPRALEAMMPYLTSNFGNPSGIHRIARDAALALDDARTSMARALNAAHATEVYFTSGGSESDNWVLRGAVQRFRDQWGEHAVPRIITSAIEHHAILHCCQALEREGVQITYLPVDAQGRVNPDDLEKALCESERNAASSSPCTENAPATALVSIMLANNEVGTVQPVRQLAAIAHEHGTPLHTDAVQAIGHIPVDIQELGVDALSLSAHKFHGPRGVGALYLREGFSIPPLIAGGAQERGERAGTENLAGVVGMVSALGEACETLGRDAARISRLRDDLTARIVAAVEGVSPTGAPCGSPSPSPAGVPAPAFDRLPSIASFVCDRVDGELLVVLLDRAGVAAATGSACSTGSTEPSHVLTAMGIDAMRAKGALRLSLGTHITPEEIDLLVERVPAAIKRARLLSGVA